MNNNEVTTLWFGLTGGIASGKSTVAQCLATCGADIIDADQLAREVVQPGSTTLEKVHSHFGDSIITPQGFLDRQRLAQIVFERPQARAQLNAIIHPAIADAARRKRKEAQRQGRPFVIYEAALIVENQLYREMDGLVVVITQPELQLQRLCARNGLSEQDARARIQAQCTNQERLAHATWVIDNSGTLAECHQQCRVVFTDMQRRLRQRHETGAP